jgi:hypothetical protein
MSHFTYNDVFNSNELSQGDVLKKTSELVEVIDKVHPYFNSTNYSHFIILTQSCDLVRRKENCKARYITIAAVRSLEDALKREALEYANSKLEIITKQLLDQKNSSKLSDFLARLFNNNIPDYFYLHPEVSRDFANPSVAFLRVSIALKSEIHYEACLAAKVLELSENFKSKLGWLVGNLYSRVGTEDWVPNNKDQQGFNSFVKKHLESNFTIIQNITELEKEILKSGKKVFLSLQNAPNNKTRQTKTAIALVLSFQGITQ